MASLLLHTERMLSGSQASVSSRPCIVLPHTHRRGRSCRHVVAHSLDNQRPQASVVPSAASPAPQLPPVIQGCQPCMDGTTQVDIDDGRVITRFVAETLLPTRHGKFRVRGYKHSIDAGRTFTEPTAIIAGVVEGQEDVPLRVHDACFTSEVLGSLKCDCAEQLALALELISKEPPGIVIYLQQEGRGIGLANKIAAYSLQERGLDTVDANRALGLPDDCREYTSVRNIINELGIKSIKLITNNPRKINQLEALGINITGRVPCVVQAANEHNLGYLQAKRDRMDHLLEGETCFWNHDGEPTQATPTTEANGGMGLPNNLQADATGRVVLVPAGMSANGNGVVKSSANGHGGPASN